MHWVVLFANIHCKISTFMHNLFRYKVIDTMRYSFKSSAINTFPLFIEKK